MNQGVGLAEETTKAIPKGDTVRFVSKKLGTLRNILAPTEEQTPAEKAAKMPQELRHHFQLLLQFVPKAISEGVYGFTDIGTTPEELQQFSTLLN